jgi:Mrp family chromosome partitioning ATPase
MMSVCGRDHACSFCPIQQSCPLDKAGHDRALVRARLSRVGQVVVVLSNKGGVGKSTVSANLAAGLAARGLRVGVADADIHGPNQSRFFGLVGARVRLSAAGLGTRTFQADGIPHPLRVGSLAFLMQDDAVPIVWRDSYKHDFIHHLLGSFDWGDLDALVVDMPPGTGNEMITLCDVLDDGGPPAAAVLVTTPQAVAQMDSLKAARVCAERDLPVIGAVENMAGVVCPHCSGSFHVFPDAGLDAALAAEGIAKIAAIPLAPELAVASDNGRPAVLDQPDGAVARAFAPVIEAVAGWEADDPAAVASAGGAR